MYLLYIDESGSVRNSNEKHFVLAGVAVFERQVYHLITQADKLVASLDLGEAHDIELHASVIASGKKAPWKGCMPRNQRLQTIEKGLDLLVHAHRSVKAFAVTVDKQVDPSSDPVEYAFEEICNRFNLFLTRLHRRGDTQRGLLVMDESHYEGALQVLARGFRDRDTRRGNMRNLAEVPLFVDSTASRLIQIADLLAWAVRRRYELEDSRYFERVAHRFDRDAGVLNGLVHLKRPEESCHCPACMSMRI